MTTNTPEKLREIIAEWEVLSRVQGSKFARDAYAHCSKVLTEYVERIEADESAVPVAMVRHYTYSGIARNGFSQEAVMLDGAPNLPDGTSLYLHPPRGVRDYAALLAERKAAAQPQGGEVTEEIVCRADVAQREFFESTTFTGDSDRLTQESVRAALLTVWPTSPGTSIRGLPEPMAERSDMDGYSNGYVTGWNAYRDAIHAVQAEPAQEDSEGKKQWDELARILDADGDNVDDVFSQARAWVEAANRIAPAQAAKVPDGFVLVPKEAGDQDAFMVFDTYIQPFRTRKDAYRIAIRKLAERSEYMLSAANLSDPEPTNPPETDSKLVGDGVPDGVIPKFELWFFRDVLDNQRQKLFSLCGMPVDEIGPSHIAQKRALRHLLSAAPTPAKGE